MLPFLFLLSFILTFIKHFLLLVLIHSKMFPLFSSYITLFLPSKRLHYKDFFFTSASSLCISFMSFSQNGDLTGFLSFIFRFYFQLIIFFSSVLPPNVDCDDVTGVCVKIRDAACGQCTSRAKKEF